MPLQRVNPNNAARRGLLRIVAAVVVVLGFALTAPRAFAIDGADIMVVFDESESMGNPEFNWIESTVAQLEAELQTLGISDNRYGLMSFGMFNSLYPGGDDHELYEPLGSIGDFTDAFDDIPHPGFGTDGKARGTFEDGYAALYDAAMLFNRDGDIARVIIFVTDEDHDEGDIGYDDIRQKLIDQQVILNVVVTADLLPDGFEDDDTQALALDSDGNAYVRGDGDTVESVVPGAAYAIEGGDNTVEDYIGLAFDVAKTTGLGAAAFDIRAIRSGNTDVLDAFTRQFLDIKIDEIEDAEPTPEVPTPSSFVGAAVLLCYTAWRTRRRE